MTPQPIPSVVVRRLTRRRAAVGPAECAAVLGVSEREYLTLERDRSLVEHPALSQLLQAMDVLAVGMQPKRVVKLWRYGRRRPFHVNAQASKLGDVA